MRRVWGPIIVFMIFLYGAVGWAFAAQSSKPAPKKAKPSMSAYTLMQNMQAMQTAQKTKRSRKNGSSNNDQKIPNGSLSLKEVLQLKQKALLYKEAVTAPAARNPGQNRILPYIPAPQEIFTAVGYGTVIEVPFIIRKKNGVVIGDTNAFKVDVLANNQVAIFPEQAFQSSNVIIFPNDNTDHPVLLYLVEAYAKGRADYFVQIKKSSAQKINANNLLSLATEGTLGNAVADALRSPSPMTINKPGVRAEYQLSNPDYRVLVLNGQMECLRGCDLWINDPNLDLTIIGAFSNTGKVLVCQKTYSQFTQRKCREINP